TLEPLRPAPDSEPLIRTSFRNNDNSSKRERTPRAEEAAGATIRAAHKDGEQSTSITNTVHSLERRDLHICAIDGTTAEDSSTTQLQEDRSSPINTGPPQIPHDSYFAEHDERQSTLQTKGLPTNAAMGMAAPDALQKATGQEPIPTPAVLELSLSAEPLHDVAKPVRGTLEDLADWKLRMRELYSDRAALAKELEEGKSGLKGIEKNIEDTRAEQRRLEDKKAAIDQEILEADKVGKRYDENLTREEEKTSTREIALRDMNDRTEHKAGATRSLEHM
ncbi:hypothetical protein LTR78_010955, partial [Recurvomyces mirabilis]